MQPQRNRFYQPEISGKGIRRPQKHVADDRAEFRADSGGDEQLKELGIDWCVASHHQSILIFRPLYGLRIPLVLQMVCPKGPLAPLPFIVANLELLIDRRYRTSAAIHPRGNLRQGHLRFAQQKHDPFDLLISEVSSLRPDHSTSLSFIKQLRKKNRTTDE